MKPLVDGVDHVFVPMTHASDAFIELTDELRLPVLWPFTSFGAFSSGGVSMGNIKFEVLDSTTAVPFSVAHEPPRIQGVAFRPARPLDEDYLAELDARSLARSEPDPFTVRGEVRWTNVYLTDVIGPDAGPFVCDYHVPGPRDLAQRRAVLEDAGGGRLGLLEALDLVISAPDVGAGRRRWQRLFDPLPPDRDGAWHPPVGPSLRLVEGPTDGVDRLILRVRSRAAADQVWQEAAMGPLGELPLQFVDGAEGGT